MILKIVYCSNNRPGNEPSEPIQTLDIYKKRCTFNIQGKADGTGIAAAALNCSGPGAPVVVAISDDLSPFAETFKVLCFPPHACMHSSHVYLLEYIHADMPY